MSRRGFTAFDRESTPDDDELHLDQPIGITAAGRRRLQDDPGWCVELFPAGWRSPPPAPLPPEPPTRPIVWLDPETE